MNNIRKTLLILSVLVAITLVAVPAFAQDSNTITITEDQINSAYWVTNPQWRAVSDRSVDLQSGQVVVSETITTRRGGAVSVVITYTPSVTNGRVVWSAAAVTHDGQPISDTLLSQINANMSSSWRHYWKVNGQPGHISAIDIGETEITLTGTGR